MFGAFLMVLIGLELLETLKVREGGNRVRVTMVLIAALIAMGRKIIVFEPESQPTEHAAGHRGDRPRVGGDALPVGARRPSPPCRHFLEIIHGRPTDAGAARQRHLTVKRGSRLGREREKEASSWAT